MNADSVYGHAEQGVTVTPSQLSRLLCNPTVPTCPPPLPASPVPPVPSSPPPLPRVPLPSSTGPVRHEAPSNMGGTTIHSSKSSRRRHSPLGSAWPKQAWPCAHSRGELNGSFFYPSRIHHILYNVYGSLLVLLLCLCKSLQRTLFLFANRCISEKRVQRYRLLRYPPNVLAIIFQK